MIIMLMMMQPPTRFTLHSFRFNMLFQTHKISSVYLILFIYFYIKFTYWNSWAFGIWFGGIAFLLQSTLTILVIFVGSAYIYRFEYHDTQVEQPFPIMPIIPVALVTKRRILICICCERGNVFAVYFHYY